MITVNFTTSSGETIYSYSFSTCTGDKNVSFVVDTSASTWCHVSTNNTDNVRIWADAVPSTQTNSRSADVKIYLNGSRLCSEFFRVIQEGVGCDCSNVTTNVSTSTFEWDAQNEKIVYAYYVSCIDASSFAVNSASLSHFNASAFDVDNGVKGIRVSTKGNNTSSSDYVETLDISSTAQGQTCHNYVTLTQHSQETSCNCNDLIIVPKYDSSEEEYIPETGGTNLLLATYNSDVCWTNIYAVPEDDWIENVTISNGEIRADILQNDDPEYYNSFRRSEIQIHGIADEHSCTEYVYVGQWGSTYNCDECISIFEWSDCEWEWNQSGSSNALTKAHVMTTAYNDVSVSISPSYFNYSKTVMSDYTEINVWPKYQNDSSYMQYISTMTITGVCGSHRCVKSVQLCQNVCETGVCACADFTLSTNEVTVTCGQTDTVEITYAGDCINNIVVSSSNNRVTTSIQGSTIYITGASVGNATVNVRYYANTTECTIKSIEVKVVSAPAECHCDNFGIVGGSYITLPSEQGSTGSVIYSGDCGVVTGVTIPADAQFWLSAYIDTSLKEVTFEAIYPNTSTSATRTATAIIEQVGTVEDECGIPVYITQSHAPVQLCLCSGFGLIGSSAITLDAQQGSSDSVFYSGDCGTVTGVTIPSSAQTWLGATLNTNNGSVTFTALADNTSTSSSREATVEIVQTGTTSDPCKLNVSITQSPSSITCDCSDFSISQTEVTVYAGGASKYIDIISGICISDITASTTYGNASVTIESGRIKITAAHVGNDVVTIYYKANGSLCSSKTIGVTISCPGTSITPNGKTMSCSGGTQQFEILEEYPL